MKTIAIIPARGGSKGIKDKNLQLIGGKSLVGLTVLGAKEAGFKRIMILSDSLPIREEARKYGADDSYIRPKNVSNSLTHMFKVYKWFFKSMKSREGVTPMSFCTLLPTTPFRSLKTIGQAKKALDSGKYDWVLSVNEYEHHPYRAMEMTEDSLLTPKFNVDKKIIWANRQELPKIYRFNGGIIGGKVEHVLNNEEYNISYNTTLKIFPVIMPQEESVDIDNQIDLELCRLIAGDYGE